MVIGFKADKVCCTNSELAELIECEKKQNDGRGVACVRTIISYIRSGAMRRAMEVRQLNASMTRGYPEVEVLLSKIFGCPNHGLDSCTHEGCK